MYTFNDLRDMSAPELQKELKNVRQELFELRITVRSGKEKDAAKIHKLQRYIAQILTVLNAGPAPVKTALKPEVKPTKVASKTSKKAKANK